MGIFDRMGRIIESNLNALLDKAEDDKKLIELNLDEMDGQVKAGHQEVVQAVAAEKQLQKRCDDLAADVGKWDRRAELALKSGDEALAREALNQKRRIGVDLASAQRAQVEQHDAAVRMKDELERMKQRLSELRMRKGTLTTRAAQARSGSGAEQLGAKGGSSAFDTFRRMEEKVEGRELAGRAMEEVEEALGKGARADDVEAKFRELERQAGQSSGEAGGVEDELAAMKKRIRI
jgi:phage shock protein A